MVVLSRLEGLHIRGLHFTETQRLTLGEVGLEEASDTGSGRRAHHVEICACPPDYAGDSCQVGSFPIHGIPRGNVCSWLFWQPSRTLSSFFWARSYILSRLPSRIKCEEDQANVSIFKGNYRSSINE
jgi:hypothetical protein